MLNFLNTRGRCLGSLTPARALPMDPTRGPIGASRAWTPLVSFCASHLDVSPSKQFLKVGSPGYHAVSRFKWHTPIIYPKGVFINTLVGGWAIENFCRQTFLTPPLQAAKTF